MSKQIQTHIHYIKAILVIGQYAITKSIAWEIPNCWFSFKYLWWFEVM